MSTYSFLKCLSHKVLNYLYEGGFNAKWIAQWHSAQNENSKSHLLLLLQLFTC